MLFGLGFEICDVDVAVRVAGHRYDLHARHGGRRGVRAMRRSGDQHHVAVTLAAALVVGADHHQTRILARGARVGLERAGGEAGDRREVLFELRDQLAVTFRLVGGCEGVHHLELGQRERLHERRGVEFHRARAERDHRVGQRDVAQLEGLDVAHQGALRAVAVEDRLGKERRAAAQRSGDAVLLDGLHGLGLAALCGAEDADDGLDLPGGRNLVEREAYGAFRGVVEVDPLVEGQRLHDGGFGFDLERIEEVLRGEFVVHRLQGAGYRYGGAVGRACGAQHSFGTVVDAVEARHRGHQGRGGADVRSGALALDVLLAHLEGHAQGAVAQPVHRDADDAARHVALEGFARGHVTRCGASEAHRDAQALRGAHGDVGAPLARCLQQGQRQQVADGRNEDAPGMCRGGEVGIVAHRAVGGRILDDGAELLAREFVFVVFVDDEFDAERFAAREQHVERLREEVAVHEELVAALLDGLARAQREHHEHRLGGGRALVEQRAVADLHARERDHGRLEVEQRLEASLRDFGLIGRVGGVPGGILEDVARHGGRYGTGVVAHADERAEDAVARGDLPDVGGKFVLAHPLLGESQRFLEADRLGDDLRDQLLDRFDPDHVEHGLQLGGVADADMAFGKFVEHIFLGLTVCMLHFYRLAAAASSGHGQGSPVARNAGRWAPASRSRSERRRAMRRTRAGSAAARSCCSPMSRRMS